MRLGGNAIVTVRPDNARSVGREVLFIEMSIKVLAIGGKAALVLPAGVFNNPSIMPLRDHIRSAADFSVCQDSKFFTA